MIFNVCVFHSQTLKIMEDPRSLTCLILQLGEELLEPDLHILSPSVRFDSGQCTYQLGSFLDYSQAFLVILRSFFVTVYHYL